MKTKLLKRLRQEAYAAIKPPCGPYLLPVTEWLNWQRYLENIHDYILRRVAELKQKRR